MPTYNEMVTEAIVALKERGGSSVQAIKKHILTSHPDLAFAPHQLRSALKKGAEAGKYIKVKSSYKLSPEAKKPLPKRVVKPAAKREVPKVTKKAPAIKKPAAKKTAGTATTKKAKAVPSKKAVASSKKSTTTKKATKKPPAKKPVSKKGSKKA